MILILIVTVDDIQFYIWTMTADFHIIPVQTLAANICDYQCLI